MSELNKALAKEKQLKEKIKSLKKKEKSKQKRLDEKRQLLIGKMVLQGMKKDSDYESRMLKNLNAFLKKKSDRELFDLNSEDA